MKNFLALFTALMMTPALAGAEATLFSVNVGKADAHLLHYGDALYLIDSGTAQGYGQLSCALETLGVTHVDGVIVTHNHQDHTGGLFALATSDLEIDAWYASAFYDVAEHKHPAVIAAGVRGQKVNWLQNGDTLPLGQGVLKVLAPVKAMAEENDNSLILLADTPDGRILLMADAKLPGEQALLDTHRLPKCEIIKIGHHGADDASSDLLLATVAPKAAIIATNTAERDTTPGPRVVKTLLKCGAEIAVTQDAQAGILTTLSGGKVQVHTAAWPEFPAAASGLRILDKDNKNETLRLYNGASNPIDLTGCFIRSEKGEEAFTIPSGTVIAPGASLLLTTLSSDQQGDILWPEEKVWDNQSEDAAYLFDVYGRLLAQSE